jgi:ABC-type lipoprotein export system ATPase subunit
MIKSLYLKNFTAFNELEIKFSTGVNIIIGENGTGKTQLLKAILALSGLEVDTRIADELLASKLCRLYHPLIDKVGELHRTGVRGDSILGATFASGKEITAKFSNNATSVKLHTKMSTHHSAAIFIPTKEVLSLVRGLTSERPHQPTIERIFDDSYLDLARLLIKEEDNDLMAKVQLNPRLASIVPRLTNLIDGRYLLKNGRFVFEPGRFVEKKAPTHSKAQHAQIYQDSTEWKFLPSSKNHLSSGMTAEGFRKIGILQQLLNNGSLNPGSSATLLWDEPESNLNPKLMKDVVTALLEIARNGQQVILATHDYVMLKWFDLLNDKGKGDHVQFHRLYRDCESSDIQLESLSDYSIVSRSTISNTFAELYDEDVKRALGGD